MTTRFALTLLTSAALLAGCPTPDDSIVSIQPPPGTVPIEPLPLAACAAGEGQLVPGWSVDNGHGAVSSLAMSPDGTAALAGADGTVKLWHIETGELNWSSTTSSGAGYGSEFGQGGPMASLSFDINGERIAAGDETGSAHIFSAADGSNLGSWSIGSAEVASVAQGYNGHIAVAATTAFGGDLHLWSITGSLDGPLETELWFVYDLSFDDREEQVLAAGDIYGIPTIEIRSAAFPGAVLGLVSVPELNGTFVSATFLEDGRVLAAGGGGLALMAPSAETVEEQTVAVTEVPDVAFVSVIALDEEHFAAATEEGVILLGTIDDLTVRATIESASISAMGMVPGGWQLASAGEDGVLRLHGCEG